ncbi:MAG: CHASE3 domain-containing protein [Candidatus Thorarchaeota archaeon]
MTRYTSWFRDSVSLFSKSVIRKWIIVVIPTCVFFMLWIGSGTLNKLFAVAGYLGWLFVTGIPFILGAVFLFGSKESQDNIADAYRADKKDRFAHLFFSYTIMVILLMSIAAAAGFVIVVTSIPSDQILVYLSSLLVSTLIVSLFISPITAFLTLIFDERKMSMGLGILLFLSFAYATGFPRNPVNYPEVAFFGPTHLHTALLFILMGGFDAYPFAADFYVGVDFVPAHLITPLIVFAIVAVISYVAARTTFRYRLRHWVIDRELLMATKGEGELWSDTQKTMTSETQVKLTTEMSNYRKRIKERRKIAAALLVAVMLLVPLGGMTYVAVQQALQQEEWTTVVYETSGVTLELGVTWLYGEFSGIEHPDNINLIVGVSGEIAGGNGGSVRYNFNHRRMTLTEYLQLNATEHDDMFASGESGQYGVPGTTFGGVGGSGPINDYTYVWVLRFLEVGGRTTGSISISFQVTIHVSPV